MKQRQHRRRRTALGLARAAFVRVEKVEAWCREVSYADLDRVLGALFDRVPPNTPRAIRWRAPLDAQLIVVDDHVFEQLRQLDELCGVPGAIAEPDNLTGKAMEALRQCAITGVGWWKP